MRARTAKTKFFKNSQDLGLSQEKISGFSLEKFQKSRILLIGAGAIGTHVALGLVRKGLGALDIFDDDEVESKNLTRQLYSPRDIGKNKAKCLARILSKQGFFKTTITGFPHRFQEAVDFTFPKYDAVICGVDNNPTRIYVARFCLKKNLPLIMSAISRDANQMYCAIQEPNKACFGCILPHAINDNSYPCNLPGIIDINQVVAGFTVFALDTLLMNRYREWNLRMVSLDGSVPDTSVLMEKKKGCEICSS